VRERGGAALRQLVASYGRAVSRSTQLGVLARPLTRTPSGGEQKQQIAVFSSAPFHD
jgi:hypothetical protein